MFELLKITEVVIGLIILVMSTLVAVFAWWDRRNRNYTDTKASAFTSSNAQVAKRLGTLENKVGQLDSDVAKIMQQVRGMPTQGDYNALRVSMADMNATLRQTSGMMKTMYEAALRASGKDA